MRFDCFYYPRLNKDGKIERLNNNIIDFDFGDKVPTKTLYYNYGKDFAIYEGGQFYIVEDSIIKSKMSLANIKYPLKLVFNQGTQLTVNSPKELPSVRLLLNGEYELEKQFGDLFYLSLMIQRKITTTQYDVMCELANSCRDFIYMNEELENSTKDLVCQLNIVGNLFCQLTKNNSELKENYLNYINFNEKEELLDLVVHKYFMPNSKDYQDLYIKNLSYFSRPIYPLSKLDPIINALNNRVQ